MYAIGSSSAKPSVTISRRFCVGASTPCASSSGRRILLAADAGVSDDVIATSVGVGGSTVYRTKQRFVVGNLEAALGEAPRPWRRGWW